MSAVRPAKMQVGVERNHASYRVKSSEVGCVVSPDPTDHPYNNTTGMVVMSWPARVLGHL